MNTNATRRRAADLNSWREMRPAFLLLVLSLVCFWAAFARAAGTNTDTKYVLLQRSGVTQTPNPASITECMARMVAMIEAEKARRTSGYVTYKCLDVSQSYVKFSATAPPPPPPPPVAQLQVYACPEAGADGRILEGATVTWANCPTAAFRNPSKSLVVAVNTGSMPFYWRSASTLTDQRIWTQTGTVGAWTRASAINWGDTPALGQVTLSWPAPTENTDDTALTDLAGYRILYGTAPDALSKSINIPNPATTRYIVSNLSPATWYFAAIAYNAAGKESGRTNVASKVIQ
jgi:hypothetical protein